ncbi:hypothetical protein L204_105142 [Cryptococcus depauperatus]|nr:hypothetical protein L204_03793 [Cryptococcus depauperatus CBS 7855]
MEYSNSAQFSYTPGEDDEQYFPQPSQSNWTNVAGWTGQEGYSVQTEEGEGEQLSTSSPQTTNRLPRSSAGHGRSGISTHIKRCAQQAKPVPHGLTEEFFKGIKSSDPKKRLGKAKFKGKTIEIYRTDQNLGDNTTRGTDPVPEEERLFLEEIDNLIDLAKITNKTKTERSNYKHAVRKCVELSDVIYGQGWDS